MSVPEQSTTNNKPRRSWWRRWLKRVGWGLLMLVIVVACRMAWRHYQVTKQLNESLTKLDRAEPGWRLEEIEAAREQIPEEENSARVVVAAARLLPKNWPSQEFDDLFAHLAPEAQLAPEDFARLKKELEAVRPALEEARKLAKMPHGRHRITYPRNPIDTLLNDQQETRPVMKLLGYDALRHDQMNDMRSALISFRAILNAARSLGDEPTAISQLVRIAGVILSCQTLERTLAQGEPSRDELPTLQKLLDNEDALSDLLIVARGERAILHGMFDAFENSDTPMSLLDRKSPNWQNYVLGWYIRDNFREAHPVMLACMNRFLDIARLPMHEQAAAERQLDAERRELKESNPVAVLLTPALNKVNEASRRKHAYLRCMAAALVAERYRQARGKWPESLDKLCPQFLAEVPLDPFDGEPLRYHRVEDGVVIYSVSSDGVDNNGNLDPEHANQPGVDIGCRLWDVTKRRRPPRPKPPKPPEPPVRMPPPVPFNRG